MMSTAPRRRPRGAIRLWAALACAGIALLLGVLGARTSMADDFFGSSPGPLTTSHASLDTADKCMDCHVGDSGGLTNDKCLGCHDHSDLKGRIAAGKGFHASSQVKGKNCQSCHLEHKGKSYNLMGWSSVSGGESGFNHDVTGWPLKGKHGAIDCSDCHKSKNRQGLRTYLGQNTLCGSCHKADQPHQFERQEMLRCDRCHGESVWKPAKSNMDFDHDSKRDASMPLEGSHGDVSCAKCHPKSVFNLPASNPASCGNSGCHDSPHDGQLFGKRDCAWCHSPTYGALDKFKFDHDKRTKFTLGSSHGKAKCEQCHTKALGESKPSMACETCHASDSKHGDRFKAFGSPPACATCHPSSSWKPSTFNHAKRAKFDLKGRHGEVGCRSCHRGSSPKDFEKLGNPTDCKGCHAHKNVHADEDPVKFGSGKCLGCHDAPGIRNVCGGRNKKDCIDQFHGPKTRFPLVKGHKFVECEECHKGGKFGGTPMECGEGCHEDSLHKGSLGETCSDCHAPGIWDATRFEHNEDTDFELKGLHLEIPTCDGCHPTREFTGTPKECSAQGCHADDDAHMGRLGDTCDKCHKETGDNLFSHNTMAAFKLEGKHLDVRCADCHPSMTFKPRPQTCFGCHPEPDVHAGQYGTTCEQCHTTRTFDDIRPLHDVGDFQLKGGHDNIACERCHKSDARPLQGTGNLCITCHKQDDIHSNSLSPRCGQCHTQWSFAPAQFDHTQVGCNLTSTHRTMPCADCHTGGNYGALAANCASCHRDTAVSKGGNHATYTQCGGCHNPASWSVSPGTSWGRDSVCR
jgi:hypothetical protein